MNKYSKKKKIYIYINIIYINKYKMDPAEKRMKDIKEAFD